jgi:nuclear mRNA export protein PCID2/THP1
MHNYEMAESRVLRTALSSQDPYRIASALDLPAINSVQTKATLKKHGEKLTIGNIDWSGVLNHYLDACDAAKAGDAEQCYQSQSSLHSSLNQIFGSSSGNWLVPALHTICRNTHVTADSADKATSRDHSKLQNAVNLLQESFSRCLNDRKEHTPGAVLSEDGSKKAGVLYIVNQLFAMYFKLNTLRLCKNLLRPVESRGLHLAGDMGDVVTYRYYVGRLYMFEDQYELAESNLEFALVHCHKSASKNKKCILRYLVPVKLFRGRLPSSACKSSYYLSIWDV